jgi:hypothetical protein
MVIMTGEPMLASDINNLTFFPKGTILMYDGDGWVDNQTIVGWYACTAANTGKGCPNLADSFIKGTDSAAKRGTAGNTGNKVTIGLNNLPMHTHSVNINTDTKGAHRHGLRSTNVDLYDGVHGFDHFDGSGGWTNAIPVAWAGGISTTYYEYFREAPNSSTRVNAMSEMGDHAHNISGNTGNNSTSNTALNIEPQSYALIYIRKCE